MTFIIFDLCAVDNRKDNSLQVGADIIAGTTDCSSYKWIWLSWQGGVYA